MSEEVEDAAYSEGSQPRSSSTGAKVLRFVVLAAVLAIVAYAYLNYSKDLSLSGLAEKEAEVRAWQQKNPVLVYGVAWLLYVAVTGLSLPGAVPLSLTYGWYFGFWRAVVIVSFGSTAGATVAFLLSRYLLRNAVQSRFSKQLESINESFRREGPFYLFTLRLITAVPFSVINVIMGLTPIAVTTFWWVSQLGMLPGTCVYVYAGSQFPDLKSLSEKGAAGILTPQLVAAFVLLGLFPIVVKKLMPKRA